LAVIDDVFRHVESTYPEEGCGLIFRGPHGDRVVPITNVYDKYHARLPHQFPRTNRTAYRMDDLAVHRALESAPDQLLCIFHSHCDVGAYFSKEDKDMAAPEGLELHPGVRWMVVAVDQGKATGFKIFTFTAGEFAEDESLRL
jgi:[CysO sulfur-carrier protein]-S-L-cysteine hydrolase